jgi:VanZ family protein
VPITILLVIAALGPEKWAPCTHLGWQFDHFIGYFGITLFFSFAWSRPFVVGEVFMTVAALLEGLQAFTPDRSAYLPAVFYGAGGALAVALVAGVETKRTSEGRIHGDETHTTGHSRETQATLDYLGEG